MKRFMMLLMGLSLPALAGYTYEVQDEDYFVAMTIENSQTMLVTGGGGYYLNLFDYSQAVIKNTSPLVEGYGGIWEIHATAYSNLAFTGGAVHRLTIGTYATAQISGGQIDQIWSSYFLPDANRIILTCNPGYLLSYTNGVVTGISGTWLDGSNFNIRLVNPAGSSTVFSNMTIIPEPATMLLLAVGG
ncbi:MAG TPA: hypothetical protein PKB02_19555, partial [Anaerohalosphaeraceae bacterium]|nr:hypothetical protein [Anaerohalosphaeraceae bacterium]